MVRYKWQIKQSTATSAIKFVCYLLKLMMDEIFPLVSCICVTSNRPVLLKRAIDCFKSQNYPNKQLLICYPSQDHQTKKVLSLLSKDLGKDVLTLEWDGKKSAENGLQLAISESTGEFICLWDDSDWHHPSRLWFQYNSVQGTRYDASILTRFIIYDNSYSRAYVSSHYLLYGSVLCKREIILAHPIESLPRAKDSALFKFLLLNRQSFLMDDCAFLYAYVYDGKHTRKFWNYEHIFNHSEQLSNELTMTIHDLLAI